MKNLFRYFAIFSVIILSMTSCSSDDNSGTSAVLLKKLTTNSFGTNAVYNFTYNGTKLSKMTFSSDNVTNGSGYQKYIYTGDLITEINRFDNNNQNTIQTLFSYNASNELIQVVKLDINSQLGFKLVYQYNPDSSVEVTGFSGNLETQNTPFESFEKYYFQNGEIASKEYFLNGMPQYTINYSYDSANHPLKNVTGLKALRIFDSMADGLFGMERNLVQRNVFDANGEVSVSESYEGDYNQDNYPKALYSADDNVTCNFQYNK